MTPFILTAVSHMAIEQKLIECGLKVPCETGFTVAEGVELSYYQSQPAVSGLIPETMDAEAIKALMGKDVDVAGTPIRAFLGQPAPDVDAYVTRKQLYLALAEIPLGEATLYEAMKTAVAQAPLEVQIWFETVSGFERHNPMVLAMLPVLGVTDEAADAIWLRAKDQPE